MEDDLYPWDWDSFYDDGDLPDDPIDDFFDIYDNYE